MEVDDPPADEARPGTPLQLENSDPPSGPSTPTPLPRVSLKRRAPYSPYRMPTVITAPISNAQAPGSICQQATAAANDQLRLLGDWKLALTSLAEALETTVSSLQGRPRELARGLVARFITLANHDTPQQGASTWASVAAPKASQGNWQSITQENCVQASQQRAQKPAQQQPQQESKADFRIFLRLPASSSLRAIGPHGIRVTLAEKIPGGITRVQAVATGYAISATEEGRAFLLSPQASGLAGDGNFEAATGFYHLVVPRIPQQLWTLEGWAPTTINDISTEAERMTGMKPLMTKLSKHPVEEGSITAVIAFPKKPRRALQLFGSSGLSRPTRPKQRPIQCTRCHRFHDTRACRSSERCISCGSSKQEHTCRMQCVNCCGPHAADYQKCPARPYAQKGSIIRLAKDTLAAVRKAGRLAFQQQLPKTASSHQAGSPHTPHQPSSQLAQELANQTLPSPEL